MTADRLQILRSAIVEVLSVVLSADTSDVLPCLDRVSALSASFTSSASDFCTHTICNMSHLSSPVVECDG